MSLCLFCKKVSHSKLGKFCSLECYWEYRAGKPRGKEIVEKIKEAKRKKPMPMAERLKIKERMTGSNNPTFGKPPWNRGLKGAQIAWNKGKNVPYAGGGFKKGATPWNKGLKGFMAGEKNALWKGGVTSERAKVRNSLEMRLWRKACMERDNFTCQKTGIRGGELQVHHINNFSSFPELRLALDNGITLSKQAHKEFHEKYGKTNNTREQIKEFLNS